MPDSPEKLKAFPDEHGEVKPKTSKAEGERPSGTAAPHNNEII